MKPKSGHRRGYPVATVIGLENEQAVLWKVFSNIVKPEKTIRLDGTRNDPKTVYNFHESIVNALRPTLREGVRSIILVSPARTNHAQEFVAHIRGHHTWLVQGPSRATFSGATGSVGTPSEVSALTRTHIFRRLISESISEETDGLVELLEKRLNASGPNAIVLYSLEEAEDLILSPRKPGKPQPEYLMLTNKYLSDSRERNRIHRLMQIATNRSVKTRIFDAESPAGLRLAQLGGIVCLAKTE